MVKEDKLKLEVYGTLTPDLFASFQLLYAPLLGKDATQLYQVLLALSTQPQKVRNHVLLQRMCDSSMDLIEKSRLLLEQYLLVKTYYDGTKNAYLYAIYMPKCGNDFLRHDVFGRIYYHKMGKQIYEFTKKNFAYEYEEKASYQEITTSLQNLMSNWDDKQEQDFENLKPHISSNEKPLSFNFDLFLSGLSNMILPEHERTAANLQFIAEKACIYGIHEKDVQMLVGKSMNLKTQKLDHKKLVSFMQKAKKEFTKKFDDPYLLPPVRFLQEKQHGVAVSISDQRLIDEVLIEKYKLQSEVVNVLLEYVLERCNQVLSKAYVEKVAATWVRLGVDTKESALAAIKNEKPSEKGYQKAVEKQLPEWFHNQDSISGEETSEDREKALAELRKLRGK